MVNPATMTRRNPMIKGLLLPTRSENQAATTAKIDAVMYTGIVSSCAELDEYPRFRMMLGRKRLIP